MILIIIINTTKPIIVKYAVFISMATASRFCNFDKKKDMYPQKMLKLFWSKDLCRFFKVMYGYNLDSSHFLM
jgi:hypothetical protein